MFAGMRENCPDGPLRPTDSERVIRSAGLPVALPGALLAVGALTCARAAAAQTIPLGLSSSARASAVVASAGASTAAQGASQPPAEVQDSSATPPAGQSTGDGSTINSLKQMSLQQLSSVVVTSVSKSAQPLSTAPAAIYVISHDDIVRSGATSLPEILRLAPNLQVAQISATSYAISARGFNLYGADKLLVLIDGRSVYTPYFSGVFWDEQQVLPQDIDRIEVISGPGATLWGANAVNGVINIITRKSDSTQGGELDPSIGTLQRQGSAQYGGRIGDQLTYRIYGTTFARDSDDTSTGAIARDGWDKTQAGMRSDWSGTSDLLTIQGDAYDGSEEQAAAPNEDILGHNVLGRWTHESSADSSLQVQGYYDYSARISPGYGGDELSVYDLDLQQSFRLGEAQQLVWGGGYRVEHDDFPNFFTLNQLTVPVADWVASLYFDPASRTLERYNLFVQDGVALSRTVNLTVGVKGEKDAYVPVAALPDVRLSWQLPDEQLLWAAVSQAVRAPSREDRDLYGSLVYGLGTTRLGAIATLIGDDMQSEKLTAYEIGYRAQPVSVLSFSVSTFYNRYQDLRSLQETPVTILPTFYDNGMEGFTYGVETWGSWQALDWWRLSAGANLLREDLTFRPGYSTIAGIASAGDDPSHQISLRSSMDLGRAFSWEADMRWIGALPDPAVPAYAELNSRIGWNASDSLTVALTGANLLHSRHVEYIVAPTTIEIARSAMLDVKLRF